MNSMCVFTLKCGIPICHVLLTVQNKHRRALLSINNRQLRGLLQKQNKAASTYINLLSLIGPWWTSRVAYNLGETQTCNCFYIFLLFGREDPDEILGSVWQEEENFEFLKDCFVQIYPTSFLQHGIYQARSVRVGKNCARGLEYGPRPKAEGHT